MFFAVFFGIVLAVLFLSALPITGPLFYLGLREIGRKIGDSADDIEKARIEAARRRAEMDAKPNPFAWSFRKSMLFSLFVLVVGVGTILIGVALGWID